MDEHEFSALARQHTPEALRTLASIAVDPKASARDRDQARKALEHGLKQLSDGISPDLRRELEDALHGK
jgi:hypothetical protein